MIITPDIFQGEITIGQIESLSVKETVNWFIDKYESEILIKVLGKTLAVKLLQEVENGIVEQKWDVLSELVKPIIANYVYSKHQRNAISNPSGSGEIFNEVETAKKTSPLPKMVRAWNEMIDLINSLNCTMQTYPFCEDFPEFCPGVIMKKINVFGI